MGMFLLALIGGYVAKDIILTKTFAIYFVIQSIICFFIGTKVWKKLEKMKQNHMTDKYKEFRRTDVDLWNKTWFMIGVVLLFPFRFIALTLIVLTYLILLNICSFGHDITKPFKGWRKFVFKYTNKILPRLALLA